MNALLRPFRGALLAALVFTFSNAVQAAPATQVPAGSSAAIGPAKQTKGNEPDTPEGKKIFTDAQSPQVRKTLQQAIDSTPAPK